MSEDAWNTSAVLMLRELWAEGLTAADISRKLKTIGVTASRSAVLGKVNRLGLSHRTTKYRPPRGVKPKQLRAKAKPTTLKIKSFESQLPKPSHVKPNAPCKGITAMRWVDHKDFTHCAMFCDGESGDAGFVCGAPAKEGSVYCENCVRVSVQPGSALVRRAA